MEFRTESDTIPSHRAQGALTEIQKYGLWLVGEAMGTAAAPGDSHAWKGVEEKSYHLLLPQITVMNSRF